MPRFYYIYFCIKEVKKNFWNTKKIEKERDNCFSVFPGGGRGSQSLIFRQLCWENVAGKHDATHEQAFFLYYPDRII